MNINIDLDCTQSEKIGLAALLEDFFNISETMQHKNVHKLDFNLAIDQINAIKVLLQYRTTIGRYNNFLEDNSEFFDWFDKQSKKE